MDISKRLKAVCDLIKYNAVADIGTDHGYVPCYLAENKKISKAVACDINAGPIESAKEHINKNGFSDIIETRLGGGLEPLKNNDAQTVIIAGMGGLLIKEILNNGKDKLENVKQLILQPQRDVVEVRKCVHSLGFKITEEIMLVDSGKYYNILNCEKGIEEYGNENDYLFGKLLIENKDKVLKEYLSKRIEKNKKILNNSKITDSDSQSLEKIKEYLKSAEEVFDLL